MANKKYHSIFSQLSRNCHERTMTGERNQLLTTIIVSILSLGVGSAMVWTSPYLAYLKSPQTPLSFPITSAEGASIGGIMPIGGLIGSFVYGRLADKIGRFWALHLNAIPQIVWWFTVIFTTDLDILLIGRFFSGLAIGGTYTLVPLYISEIASDKIRGQLNAIFVFSMNLGMLLIYIAGEFLNFFTAHVLFALLPFAFMVLFAFLPETPIYLLKKNKYEEAEKALKFFRGVGKYKKLDQNFINEMGKLNRKVEESLKIRSGWKEITAPVSLKALYYGMILISLHQFSGLMAFIGYTADIFRQSGSSLSPNMSTIIVGFLLIAGSLFSVIVMDKFTRRSLFTLTSIGNIIGLLMMGFYGFFEQFYDLSELNFVPIISLSLVILSSTAGRFPLSYLIVAEIQPQNNRSFGISVCSAVNWFVAFLVLRYFSLVVENFTFHNCMFLFCLSLILNMGFVILYIPETKGKSYEEIENSLKSRKVREAEQETQMKLMSVDR